jgi:hypothetical protein
VRYKCASIDTRHPSANESNPMKLFPLPTALMLVALGCASTQVMPLTPVGQPAKPEGCRLEVFTDESRIQRKYTELAIITHKTKMDAFSSKSGAVITDVLRKEACGVGADALILRSVVHGRWGDAGTGEAIAIRFQ